MRFSCRTLFDITATKVTGHFRSARIPFVDSAGQSIINEEAWTRSRNQQRNWETITQLISMRTQIFELTTPVKNNDHWEFQFETEAPDVYGTATHPTEVLEADSNGVPMLIHLDNVDTVSEMLLTSSPDQNIWFSVL